MLQARIPIFNILLLLNQMAAAPLIEACNVKGSPTSMFLDCLMDVCHTSPGLFFGHMLEQRWIHQNLVLCWKFKFSASGTKGEAQFPVLLYRSVIGNLRVYFDQILYIISCIQTRCTIFFFLSLWITLSWTFHNKVSIWKYLNMCSRRKVFA